MTSKTPPLALVVDDNRLIASNLVKMLTLLGYEAHAVHGALPAMQVLEANVPELVLLDIHLQGVNGVDVCKFIRRSKRLTFTLVVGMSSDTQPELITGMRQAGANGFLAKPIQVEVLEQALADARADMVRRVNEWATTRPLGTQQ